MKRETATCCVRDCDREVFARGMCNSHYYAALDEEKWGLEVCGWPRCSKSVRAAGFCTTHYSRIRYARL